MTSDINIENSKGEARNPRPLQIVKTGEGDNFELCRENLEEVISQIPSGMKVSVVSLVGAFRTGKSFLLNFFLRYLRHGSADDLSLQWMTSDGDLLAEGNMNTNSNENKNSFAWRGGQERQTTGIWMWSEPFIRIVDVVNDEQIKTGEEKIAVLLLDTQGMFDNETTMTVTAQIFGLSTLVSSYQIYNVDKRIQEDNLQHLALFSEYGRMALYKPEVQHVEEQVEALKVELTTASTSAVEPSQTTSRSETSTPVAARSTWKDVDTTDLASSDLADRLAAADSADEDYVQVHKSRDIDTASEGGDIVRELLVQAKKRGEVTRKPFQRLQFLVRDWQNFDEDLLSDVQSSHGDEDSQQKQYNKFRESMNSYLNDVMKTRQMSDLQNTREQISKCFDIVDCYMLSHPGFDVVRKNYSGDIAKIDPLFKLLLNYFVREVFHSQMEPKFINNRPITGKELLQYFVVYCELFQSSMTDENGQQRGFPKAMTMLEATAEANNRNAYDLARDEYREMMNAVVAPDAIERKQGKPSSQGNKVSVYVKESELLNAHKSAEQKALEVFDEIASMGAESAIADYRKKLSAEIELLMKEYFSTNALRNPFKDTEKYILPAVVGVISYILSRFIDNVCSADVCEVAEKGLRKVYLLIFTLIIFFAWRHIRGTLKYVQELLVPMVMEKVQAHN